MALELSQLREEHARAASEQERAELQARLREVELKQDEAIERARALQAEVQRLQAERVRLRARSKNRAVSLDLESPWP
jgi:hypothetical protein